jgi:riboflavin synthase
MFTGIVETTGKVESCRFSSGRRSLLLQLRVPRLLRRLKIGGSLAVNGVCLTVIKKKGACVSFNVIRESVRRSMLGQLKKGDRVNLERPMKASDRLEGHIVLGHVDTVGVIRRVVKKGAEKDFQISFPAALKSHVLEKGSIAVDGVSLTLGKIQRQRFWIHCIPHTLRATNFGHYKEGTRVNLEADVLIKMAMKQLRSKVH